MRPLRVRLRVISILISAIVLLGLSSNAIGEAAVGTTEKSAKVEKDVITLTSRDFDAKVGSGGIWLVEFYADWCG